MCAFPFFFNMFVSFDLRVGLAHVEMNVKTLFDFDEVVVLHILSFCNIMNTTRDRAWNVVFKKLRSEGKAIYLQEIYVELP